MKRISLYRSLPLFIAVRGMWAAFGRHFTVLQRKKRAERRSENANKPSIHAAFRRSTDCIGHFEAGTKSYYFLSDITCISKNARTTIIMQLNTIGVSFRPKYL